MASLGRPVFRHGLRKAQTYCQPAQKRWAQVHDVRFAATHQPIAQRVEEKYKSKLEEKARGIGLKDINELKQIYREKAQQEPEAANEAKAASASPFPPPPPPPQIPSATSTSPQVDPAKAQPSTPPGVKTLSSFIDIPRTLELPVKEIEYIWRLRHASSSNSLCALIPLNTYQRIEDTAREHPQFILPLPRKGQGAEIHFLQWTFPTPNTGTVLFTHLAEYKLRGEYASPHTTVTHHLELAKEKGIVLLQGNVIEGRGISVEEGRWLLMCLQRFYGMEQDGGKPGRSKLLRQFSKGDGGFRIEELLEEAEKVV